MTPAASDAFNYLAVLFSIIIGLAVTEILQGFRRLLLTRNRVRLYAPAVIWAFTLLLSLSQTWWAMFGLRHHDEWTFGMYAAVLLQTVILYMVAALALPDQPDGGEAEMRATYYEHARPLFSLMAAAAAASLLKEWVTEGGVTPTNLVFHLAFICATVLAAVTRRAWYHQFLAPAAALFYGLYVVVLFNKL
ncbi:MAG: hypothetical protein Q8M88_02190 [Phenylobacterium sp.]|uniref:hypothetical protein n=1 Tax=Phenylobacterium sp. TaxID=1871053 RepID=UPI00273261D8|nr:hypothetical protein [Phenylobacterium sp.]MDP3173228.1 hypothetical protein [Phenylobacterium sp.]